MKTIAVVASKGGAGKTTTTRSLAVAAKMAGIQRVMMIDADSVGSQPQLSLTKWAKARQVAPKLELIEDPLPAVRKAYANIKRQDGLLLIDTPPHADDTARMAIEIADLVLIPVQPSPDDLRAVGAAVKLVQDIGKPFMFIVSRAKQNTDLLRQAYQALSKYEVAGTIHDRAAYAVSAASGKTIFEVPKRDRDGKGAAEVSDVWNVCADQLDLPKLEVESLAAAV